MELNISEIKVGKRFRKDMGDLDSLAASMDRLGLLQDILVTSDYELIAGQRRFKAAKKLGWRKKAQGRQGPHGGCAASGSRTG